MKELTFYEKLNKPKIALYPVDQAELIYKDVRLKNSDGTPSIYKAVGNFWKINCIDDFGSDYSVLFEYDDNRQYFSEYDNDEVFVVLKDYNNCGEYRICALWTVDDEIDYIIQWD